MENKLFDLTAKRRSVRRYTNEHISDEVLNKIMKVALGACWVHIRNRTGKRKSSDEEIRKLLGVPDGYAVLNLIALGGKGEIKRGYTEKDFDFGKVHYEKY